MSGSRRPSAREHDPDDPLRITCEVEVAPLVEAERLHVLHGVDTEHLGTFFVVREGEDLVAGRKLGLEAQLSSAGVSRVHAVFRVSAEAVWVKDAGSRNGTYVNGARLGAAARLSIGDVVTLGEARLRYSIDTQSSLKQLAQLRDAALRDHLTAAYNRRHFEERLQAELAFTVRHGSPLSLLLFDLDRFKRINDEHGHAAGDAVLRAFSAMLMQSVRTEDVVARWGGEEFAVLARGTDGRGAFALADRLRLRAASLRPSLSGRTLRFTTSVGVCAVDGKNLALSTAQLLRFTDLALYEAKRTGRDRVVDYADLAALGTQPMNVARPSEPA